jgi:hypothetical protein
LKGAMSRFFAVEMFFSEATEIIFSYFRKYVVELVSMGCLLACFQWLSWQYRLNLLSHVVFIKENLFLIQKLFILRLLDTIGSQIDFFLKFNRNLPQYPCCSIRATDMKIDK